MKDFFCLRSEPLRHSGINAVKGPVRRTMPSLYAVAFLFAGACEARPGNDISPVSPSRSEGAATRTSSTDNVYGHRVTDIDGKPVALDKYRGKVSLVVNTASACGYTSQYGDLEALYQSYRERGFEVLAFPSNDFGGQEPNDEAFIKSFTAENFGVSFPLFAKTRTRGAAKSPLYQTLTEQGPEQFRGEVGWNFTKFLVDPQGRIVARFGSSTSPTAPELREAIEKALETRSGTAKAPPTP